MSRTLLAGSVPTVVTFDGGWQVAVVEVLEVFGCRDENFVVSRGEAFWNALVLVRWPCGVHVGFHVCQTNRAACFAHDQVKCLD